MDARECYVEDQYSGNGYIDGGSDDDLVPISHQLLEAERRWRHTGLWPIHRHASPLLATIITGCYALTILISATTITAYILNWNPIQLNELLTRRAPQLLSTDNLSWPSACWAIVTIALNTMCQPFGKVLNLPEQHSFALRSSPIVCFADTVVLLTGFIYYSIQNRSLFEGASRTIIARFNADSTGGGSFGTLQKNTLLRAILLFLGALPQVAKLYATSNAPWTKAWASIYLATFLLFELVGALARQERVLGAIQLQSTRQHEGLCRLFTIFVLAISIGFAYVSFAAAIFLLMRDYWTFAAWPIILAACLLNVLSIWSLVSSKRDILILSTGPLIAVAGASMSGTVAPSLSVFAYSMQLTWIIPSEQMVTATLLVAIFIAAIFTSASFYRLTHNLHTRYRKYMHLELSSYYFLLHLITIFLGYGFLYNPDSTQQPAWTKPLG